MKIATYNVNGIRAAMKKGLLEWIDEKKFDVVCLQETKAMESQIDVSLIENMGYSHHWHGAEKKGYSGVSTFTKTTPELVESGLGIEKFDREGRVIRTDIGEITILNCYFPSGSSGEERHEVKMDFLEKFRPWVEELLKERKKIIVVGDYNIVHTEKDIHNPKRRDNPSGYRPEERAWMDKWFSEVGFHDAYRLVKPKEIDVFSWWSYRGGSRDRNKGWRIDYMSVSDALKDQVINVQHYPDVKHSDHCCIELELK